MMAQEAYVDGERGRVCRADVQIHVRAALEAVRNIQDGRRRRHLGRGLESVEGLRRGGRRGRRGDGRDGNKRAGKEGGKEGVGEEDVIGMLGYRVVRVDEG